MGQESSVGKALHDAIDTLIAFRSSFNQITVGPITRRYATLARLYHKAGNQQKAFEIIKKIEEMKNSQMDR